MLRMTRGGYVISCDKCGRTIRDDIQSLTRKSAKKYRGKRSYCGLCIQRRLHRNQPDYDYHAEFKFKSNQEKAEQLEKLMMFFV